MSTYGGRLEPPHHKRARISEQEEFREDARNSEADAVGVVVDVAPNICQFLDPVSIYRWVAAGGVIPKHITPTPTSIHAQVLLLCAFGSNFRFEAKEKGNSDYDNQNVAGKEGHAAIAAALRSVFSSNADSNACAKFPQQSFERKKEFLLRLTAENESIAIDPEKDEHCLSVSQWLQSSNYNDKKQSNTTLENGPYIVALTRFLTRLLGACVTSSEHSREKQVVTLYDSLAAAHSCGFLFDATLHDDLFLVVEAKNLLGQQRLSLLDMVAKSDEKREINCQHDFRNPSEPFDAFSEWKTTVVTAPVVQPPPKEHYMEMTKEWFQSYALRKVDDYLAKRWPTRSMSFLFCPIIFLI